MTVRRVMRSVRQAAFIALGLVALIVVTGCGAPDDTAAPGKAATEGSADSGTLASQRIDFTLPDLAGEPQSLSQWDGDLVLLNFWATWCPPCTKEMPLFQQYHEVHAENGFTIVAIAVDELGATQAFVDTFGIEFPILIGQDEAMAVGRDYGNHIGALPYTVLIDREGVVRETHRGEVTQADLDAWLQRHL